jgi:transposase
MVKKKNGKWMMRELNYFLGFQVKQLKEGTSISQTKYTQDLLKRFGMKYAKPTKTPMGTDGHLGLDKGVSPLIKWHTSL